MNVSCAWRLFPGKMGATGQLSTLVPQERRGFLAKRMAGSVCRGDYRLGLLLISGGGGAGGGVGQEGQVCECCCLSGARGDDVSSVVSLVRRLGCVPFLLPAGRLRVLRARRGWRPAARQEQDGADGRKMMVNFRRVPQKRTQIHVAALRAESSFGAAARQRDSSPAIESAPWRLDREQDRGATQMCGLCGERRWALMIVVISSKRQLRA